MGWSAKLFALVAASGLAGCAGHVSPIPFDSPAHRPATERAVGAWTKDRLVTFRDEREFEDYMSDVRDAARARGDWWAFAARDLKGTDEGTITVTGSRVQPRNASITNVQEAGVDEGDIVKQIDHYLLVLSDGRIFVIDTRPGGAPGLALRDRINVYRDPKSDAWYDEMLVHGDRIVVAGYSYEKAVSEIAVFRLEPDGQIRSEGVFHIASDDYYDDRNYATRLVGGQLLLYTPIDLTDLKEGKRLRWPSLRRVGEGRGGRDRRLIGPRDLHRPLFTTFEPVIHAISICPLGRGGAGRDLVCRSTAFIGASYSLLYVSPEAAYLWAGPTSRDEEHLLDPAACRPGRPLDEDNWRGVLHRIPHRGGAPGVVAVRGSYVDHFAVQERDGELRGLVQDGSVRCDYRERQEEAARPFSFVSVPQEAFRQVLREADPAGYQPLPPVAITDGNIAARMTEDYLVYGGLGERHHYPEREDQPPPDTQVVAVPVREPAAAQVLSVPHGVIRAEQAGEDIVLTGYRGAEALSVSLIDLSGAPRVASTYRFDGRFESEGRSHAFNSLVGEENEGLIALPTVPLARDGERLPSWSRPSDVDFLRLDRAGALQSSGRLETSIPEWVRQRGQQAELDGEPDEDSIPGYSCEVSCVDWYGNTRPIFTDGRIFALVGSELVEGRQERGRIVEVRRLDFARARPPR